MHPFFVGSRMPDLSLLILLIQLITSTTLALTCLSQTQLIGDDSACLVGLKASVQQLDVVTSSLGSSADLSTWSSEALSSPCSASASAETTSTTYSSSAPSNVMDGVACNNNRVYAITLNASNLAGTIPPAIANCTYLQILDLSSNGLAGAIPTSVGKLSYLTSLNLSNNQLDGSIPVELSACEYLNDLDLHHNKLSGNIPGQIGLLQRLKVLDVSDNELWGSIPTTLSNSSSTGLPRFNASSFQGNDGLYGFPLPPSAFRGLSVMAILGIGLASGLVSLIVSFSAVCIWLRVTEQGYAAEEGQISQLVSAET